MKIYIEFTEIYIVYLGGIDNNQDSTLAQIAIQCICTAAMVYTSSFDTAAKAAAGLDIGNVAVNNPDAGAVSSPYGGCKGSGYGYEHGKEGLHEYLKIKHMRSKVSQ